ncbi:hypothetical protein [Novosphingobium huizhouense]|uniref:hypothetical protein n=1 Tax=Novosphingobium huizhouense TaxID=2866625 RepID=UPI001CD84D34|nr:hypothetical protein [Novosphingobium huizhouense]
MDLFAERIGNAAVSHPRLFDLVIRFSGLAVLGALPGLLAVERNEDLLHGPGSPHSALAALAVVVALWSGLCLIVAGAELLKPQPAPPRSWLPVRGVRRL